MTTRNNPIFDYYAEIKSGRLAAGMWIRRVYEILIGGLERGDYAYSARNANRVIKFIETFCRHSEGREDRLKLELWQKAFLAAVFGIVEKDTANADTNADTARTRRSARVFREIVLIVGRKNGKTLLASAIAAYMAYLDGEYGARIYCMAPKLEQANIIFDNFHQMLKKEPELLADARKRRTDIYIASTNTSVKPLAFSAKKSDGFNPHLVVNDEIASWPAEPGLKQYEVMKSALGARKQPLIMSISTAGYVNDGIYDELINRATAFLKGGSRERRLLPFLYVIDDADKWDDIEEIKKANPNIGVSVNAGFFRDEIAVAENSMSKRAEFLTKYCNIKQSSSTAWFDYAVIDRAGITGVTLNDFKDCYAVAGVDLSQTTDLTAASVIIEKGGKLYCFARFFMPANKLDELRMRDSVPYDIFLQKGILTLSGENYVDYKDITAWFNSLRTDYGLYILKVGYDRYSSTYLVDELNDNGYQTDDVRQGDNLSPVILELEGIIKDNNFYIVDNSLLKSHFLNVALKQNLETRQYRPVKIEQRHRIDGFVSVIDAMTVRQKYWNDIGGYLKNE